MKLWQLLEEGHGVYNDRTRFVISLLCDDWTTGGKKWIVVASGNWFQDQIIQYEAHEIIEFTADLRNNMISLHLDGYLEI